MLPQIQLTSRELLNTNYIYILMHAWKRDIKTDLLKMKD